MATSPSADRSASKPLHALMYTIVAGVREDTPDLTARQLGVFLKAYLEPAKEHTVRGLAVELNVSKPAITRALDRLADFDLIKREKDKNDRRSIIVRRTPAGSTHLRTINGYLNDASRQSPKQRTAT